MKKITTGSAMLVVLTSILISGCQIVQVVDLSGNPVMGAKVDVLDTRDASKIVLPSITGLDGCALLPLPMGSAPEKLMASKDNYSNKVLRKKDTKVIIRLGLPTEKVKNAIEGATSGTATSKTVTPGLERNK